MRVVIQRVLAASVVVDGEERSAILKGLLVFCGVEDADGLEDIEWISHKIVNLRIFNDDDGIPNLSLKESGGDILLVSQFTLHALTKKGNRPSYIRAARPEKAEIVYQQMILKLETALGKSIFTGTFGADMKISLVNDGPITILIDSRNRE